AHGWNADSAAWQRRAARDLAVHRAELDPAFAADSRRRRCAARSTAGVDRRHVRGPAARARPVRGGVRGGVLARVARGTTAPADASSLRVDVSRPGHAPPVRAYAAPCRLSSSTVAVAA